jgi:hypothetical protein
MIFRKVTPAKEVVITPARNIGGITPVKKGAN